MKENGQRTQVEGRDEKTGRIAEVSDPALHNADNPSQYYSGDATAKQLADNGANIHSTGRAHDARQEKLLQNLTSNATANCARDGVAQRAKTNVL